MVGSKAWFLAGWHRSIRRLSQRIRARDVDLRGGGRCCSIADIQLAESTLVIGGDKMRNTRGNELDADSNLSADESQDNELLTRWRAGDQQAARDLYERNISVVRRVVRLCRVPAADVDVVALRPFEWLFATKRPVRSVRRALLHYARKRSITWLESSRRSRNPTVAAAQLLSGLRNLGSELSPLDESASYRRRLLRALRTLEKNRPGAATELVLQQWEGMTAVQISELLEIPVNTVYSRIRRSKEELRKLCTHVTSAPIGSTERLLEENVKSIVRRKRG